MVNLGLWKGLTIQESLELRFELWPLKKFRRVAGNEFQTGGAMKLKKRLRTLLKFPLGSFKGLSLEDQRVRVV